MAWRARSFDLVANKFEPISFAEHGVATDVSAQLCRDLAGAQALAPELGEQLDPVLGPCLAHICHRCLQAESLFEADSG